MTGMGINALLNESTCPFVHFVYLTRLLFIRLCFHFTLQLICLCIVRCSLQFFPGCVFIHRWLASSNTTRCQMICVNAYWNMSCHSDSFYSDFNPFGHHKFIVALASRSFFFSLSPSLCPFFNSSLWLRAFSEYIYKSIFSVNTKGQTEKRETKTHERPGWVNERASQRERETKG